MLLSRKIKEECELSKMKGNINNIDKLVSIQLSKNI